ncbi:hypothetical protein ACLOJK_027795 [Asimina triloba]
MKVGLALMRRPHVKFARGTLIVPDKRNQSPNTFWKVTGGLFYCHFNGQNFNLRGIGDLGLHSGHRLDSSSAKENRGTEG